MVEFLAVADEVVDVGDGEGVPNPPIEPIWLRRLKPGTAIRLLKMIGTQRTLVHDQHARFLLLRAGRVIDLAHG